ncbi:MAG TPA: GTPase domain-containing protein [Prosthecobacter sp.]|nr:GTPase domain-containing protein [Prosthecobacter sp.]HRK17213.1 GTPase domain-containing protein [Prosthecobacter sp.]
MPVLNTEQKTVSFKIVYCGTHLSGKTANLQQIHAKLDPQGRSDLVSLSTARDRTLFFDFLSIESAALPGYKTAFQLYTVPGQVTYNATLQLVLRQADGVVFVADSQLDRQRDNIQALQALDANLRLNGHSLDRIPLVLQYNKRDLPNTAPVEYLEFLLNNRPRPWLSFEAEARAGKNVLATLNAISQAVLSSFQARQAGRLQAEAVAA